MKFFRQHQKKIIAALIIGLILFLGIRQIQAQKYRRPEVYNPKKDTEVKAEYKNLRESLTLSGSIDAQARADVRFQTGGRLVWVGVKEGDRVRKWQSLASLDRQELKKQLEISFNNYRSELSRFDDTQDKYKDEKEALVLTDEMKRILARSQFSLNNAVVAYELNDLALKYATIWSPINGIVVKVEQPNPGVNITPANSTFTIIDPNSLYLKAEIDQEDVSKVYLGQNATVKIDAFPDEEINSTLTYISFTPVAGQTSTVYEVRFSLPKNNQNLRYRLDMDGDVSLILKEASNTLTLPIDALNQEDDKSYVWVKRNSQLEKNYVTVGLETDTEVEIVSGLNPDETVIIKKI